MYGLPAYIAARSHLTSSLDGSQYHFPGAIVVSVIGYGAAARTFKNERTLLYLAITASVISGAFTVFSE